MTLRRLLPACLFLVGSIFACSDTEDAGDDATGLGPNDSSTGVPTSSGAPEGTGTPTSSATNGGPGSQTPAPTPPPGASTPPAPVDTTPPSTPPAPVDTTPPSDGNGGAPSDSTPGAGGSSDGDGGANDGGAATGGTGGSPDGAGGTSNGGSGGNAGSDDRQSPGCGSTSNPASGRHTVQSSGAMRSYVLDIPNDYDANHPYRLFFTWHWRGGNANDVVNGSGNASRGPYYGLKSRANGSAIFVSPEGLVDSGVTGWANPNGRDIQFLRDMLDQLNAELCIDQDRIFSTGFSYGGMMSLAVGCAMGDVFRAIAPMAGAIFSGCASGDSPVAFWGSHAPGDGVVGIAQGRQGRDEFIRRNGCGSGTTPGANGCVSYEGCAEGNPVVWCEFSGDHFTPDFAPDATWEFFSQF